MPISEARCRLWPGSVKIGGTWQLAQLAAPLKTSFPRSAAIGSNEPAAAVGIGSES